MKKSCQLAVVVEVELCDVCVTCGCERALSLAVTLLGGYQGGDASSLRHGGSISDPTYELG